MRSCNCVEKSSVEEEGGPIYADLNCGGGVVVRSFDLQYHAIPFSRLLLSLHKFI